MENEKWKGFVDGGVEKGEGGGHGVPPLRRFAFDPDFAVGEYFFFPDGDSFL